MSIEFDRDQIKMTDNADQVVYETTYSNSQIVPMFTTYLQSHQGVSVSESFQKVSGFNLISGMTYNINAQVPRLDVEGNLFFTMKTLREWTYGVPNNKNTSHLFESFVMVPEMDDTKLQIIVKSKNVQISFEA
jgi:hypothetical protein